MSKLSSGRPRRVWINQPSTLQPHHKLHGKYAIAIPEEGPVCDIHFTEGDVHSMRIQKLCISVVKLSSAED